MHAYLYVFRLITVCVFKDTKTNAHTKQGDSRCSCCCCYAALISFKCRRVIDTR